MTNRERSKEIAHWRKVIKSYDAKKVLTIDDRQELYYAESKIEELYATKVTADCSCNPPMGQFDTECHKHGIAQ